MNFIVLDLEWNQAPGGKSCEVPGLPFEIIEIGAIKVDENHRILGTFCEVVRPQVYRKLHHRTQQVVQLRNVDLANARTFPEVAADFFAWCGANPLFCTWGPADLCELQRNLAWHHMDNPFPYPLFYFDIQKIFAITFSDRHDRRSLEYAVDSLDLATDVPFHSALGDAWYTAMVMKYLACDRILENSSIDYYRTPKNRAQEISWKYPHYTKFISRPYANKRQALRDKRVTAVYCPHCHRKAETEIPWFPLGGRSCCSLSLCREHGYLKGKIRFRQTPEGASYVIRTIRCADEEEAGALRQTGLTYMHKRK